MVLQRAALSMSSAYHTPVDYWLTLPLSEFYTWVTTAHAMTEEQSKH